MSYRQDKSRRLKNIRFFSFVIIAGTVFYFFSTLILNNGFGLLSFVVSPIWRLERSVMNSFDNASSIFKSKRLLEIENEKLTEELNSIRIKLDSLNSLQRENEELMIEMGREFSRTSHSILAAVLSGPNVPPYEGLIIDVGKNQAVSVGDRVIYESNIVLGEVSQVFDQVSKVKLYSASGIQTDVLVQSEEVLHAVALGFGGGNFSIDLPSSIVVNKGMQILIPGGDIYVLGIVDYIKVDPTTASQRILIKYPINIKNIRFVHVIRASTNDLE